MMTSTYASETGFARVKMAPEIPVTIANQTAALPIWLRIFASSRSEIRNSWSTATPRSLKHEAEINPVGCGRKVLGPGHHPRLSRRPSIRRECATFIGPHDA